MFSGQTAHRVADAIRAAGIDGWIAVVGDVGLARAIGDDGKHVIAIARSARELRRARGARVRAGVDALPLGERALAAIVASGLAEIDAWQPILSAWCAMVADRGLIVLVDRAEPTEIARRALCGGLAELEQRRAGRAVVTCGRVRCWS